jgi:hypothetical protein
VFLGRSLVPFDLLGFAAPWLSTVPGGPLHNPTLTDALTQFYPWRAFQYATLRQGEWPLWNPYIFAGHPSFASINEQVFYPLNVLLAFLPAESSFGWLVWLQLAIWGIGVRAFAKLLVEDEASACLAAVVAMFAAPVVVWLSYPMFLSTLAWTGWIFFFLELLWRSGRPRYAGLAGLAGGLGLLGGQTQLSVYVAGLVALYGAFRLAALSRKRPATLPARVGWTAAAAVSAGAIGSLAYLPALANLATSSRLAATYPALLATALPLDHLWTFLLPNVFGSPLRGDYHGSADFNETATYLGILPVCLACTIPGVRRQRALVLALAIGALGVGLLLFGLPLAVRIFWWLAPPARYFGLSRLGIVLPLLVGLLAAALYADLPAVGRERTVHSGLAVAGAVALAILLERFAPQPGGEPTLFPTIPEALAGVVASLGVCLARIWLSRDHPIRWAGPLLAAADLFLFGVGYNTYSATNPLGNSVVPPLDHVEVGPFAARTVGISLHPYVLPPNLATPGQIPTPDGYTSEANLPFVRFLAHANGLAGADDPTSSFLAEYHLGDLEKLSQARPPYLDLLGVRYLLTGSEREIPDLLRTDANSSTPPIFGATTVGATFRAHQNGLNRIDVYPVSPLPPAVGWIALHLKASPNAGEHLAYVRIEGRDIHPDQPLTFYFKPIANSAGQSFYAYLDAPESSGTNALRLQLNSGDTTPTGSYLLNDQASSGKLAFAAYSDPFSTYPEIARANGTTLYQNPSALPRAFLVGRINVGSDEQFYAGLDDGSIDPGSTAVVAEPPPFALATVPGRNPAPVTVENASAGSVDLQVTLEQPGLVVITNAWYPGWKATVDGRPETVVRADAVFQGVYLQPGAHHVRLSFAPPIVRFGLLFACAGVALAVGLLAIDRIRDRKSVPRMLIGRESRLGGGTSRSP